MDIAERARGRCLSALAWALVERVDLLVVEGRQKVQDRHDASVLRAVRVGGAAPAVTFATKADDPLLWAADIVAGAVFHDVARADPSYRQALGPVEIHTV